MQFPHDFSTDGPWFPKHLLLPPDDGACEYEGTWGVETLEEVPRSIGVVLRGGPPKDDSDVAALGGYFVRAAGLRGMIALGVHELDDTQLLVSFTDKSGKLCRGVFGPMTV